MQNIPLFKIYWDEQDIAEITTAVRSGVSWAIGSNIEKFEKGIAEYIGTKYAVVFNSGTSALHAALLTYELGEGAEVIVPSFTFIATANAALFVGAKPVFAEIEEETYGLDPADVRRKITPKTRAIIPIHYGGCPCLVNELKQIVEEHGLILIEDAAEAFGAAINGKKVGSFGDAAILSCTMCALVAGDHIELASQTYDMLTSSPLKHSQETVNRTAVFRRTLYVGAGYLEKLILQQLRQTTSTPSGRDMAAGVLRQAGADLLDRIAADSGNVLAQRDDTRVTAHLLLERFIDGFGVGQLTHHATSPTNKSCNASSGAG